MAKKLSKAAAKALEPADWSKLDRMTDADIARQIGTNPRCRNGNGAPNAPSGPARTLLRAIKVDPKGLRKALATA